MKKIISYLILFSLPFLIIGCGSGNKNFNQEGYFKNNARNRIFTYSFKSGTTKQEVKEYARNLMNTPGRMTAAYFYPEGSLIPRDGVTLANSMDRVNYVLYDMPGLNKWRYAYMKYFTGSSEFVDCQESPNHDLCRKN